MAAWEGGAAHGEGLEWGLPVKTSPALLRAGGQNMIPEQALSPYRLGWDKGPKMESDSD